MYFQKTNPEFQFLLATHIISKQTSDKKTYQNKLITVCLSWLSTTCQLSYDAMGWTVYILKKDFFLKSLLILSANFYPKNSKADNWPPRLIMQLMPKALVGSAGGQYIKESKTVVFIPQPCDALEALSKVMGSGFVSIFRFMI